MEKYSKSAFDHISYMRDCTANERKVVEDINAETFKDGYKFCFDETANESYKNDKIRCEYRESMDGVMTVFFFRKHSQKVEWFVTDRNLRILLMKVYDLAFTN